jgi:glycosyltransferase involved in cell wall biosynthesis
MQLHIAVEATCWHNQRGYGRHARALLTELVALGSHRYTFVTDGQASDITLDTVEVRTVRNRTASRDALRAGGRRSIGDMARMSRALSASEFDVVLFPSIFSYVPVISGARKIVFQHDVIAETFPKLTTPSLAARTFWKMKCWLAQKQADRMVTVSEYSRRTIARLLGWTPSRLAVVGEAPAEVFQPLADPQPFGALETLGIHWNRPMLVYVGGFSPHKNLLGLARAFAGLRREERFAGLQLVLVGETKSETFLSCLRELREECERLGIGGRVVFTGYLPDGELAVLLNRATALVLPSLMEGFGLPAVEAAACGCPVIATRESPLPELLGEGGVYVDPRDGAALANAMRLVAGDEALRLRMRKRGLEAAGRLSWPAHAADLLELIEECAAPGAADTEDRREKSWVRT